MTQLAAPSPRTMFGPGTRSSVQQPMDAAAVIYEGSGVTMNPASGGARQLVVADATFLGFAARTANNTTGWISGNALPPTAAAVGSQVAEIVQEGKILLPVAAGGVLVNSAEDVGLPVYATDGNTFTGLLTAALKIGFIDQWISSGLYVVHFYATSLKQT